MVDILAGFPEIYVIRHGQTIWNAEGRHQGRRDSALTQLGLSQAREMGDLLCQEREDWSSFSALFSPQGRAAQTAAYVFGALGLEGATDRRLREVAFGDWEGKTADDIAACGPEMVRMMEEDPFALHFLSPGGETFEDMAERCQAFLADLTGPAVIVCHGITSRVMRGIWLGLDFGQMSELPGGQGCIFHLGPHGHRRIAGQ